MIEDASSEASPEISVVPIISDATRGGE